MTNTGYARTMAPIEDARGLRRERHASSTEWEPLAEFGPWTPPSSEPWHVAAYCTADVDTGSVGQLRLRSSASSVVTNGVTVSAHARNIRLGFQGVANTAQTIYVEGRRTSGTGGVRLIDAQLSAVSAPPASLVVGGVPVGGGVGEVIPLAVATGVGNTQTLTSPAFNPPANHRLVVVARAVRANHATAFTWSVTDSGGLGSWQADSAGPVEPSSGNLFGRAICVQSIGVGATPPTGVTVTVDAFTGTALGGYALAVFAVPDPGNTWLRQSAAFGYGGSLNTATATLAAPPSGRPVAVFFHESSDVSTWQTPADGWVSRLESPAGTMGAIILAANSDTDGAITQASTSATPFATHGVFLDVGVGSSTSTAVRSTFVSDTESTTFTILPSWFSPAVQPGDKVVLIGAAPGPSDVSSFSWLSFPGAGLTGASGGTYNPRVMCTVADYSAAGWTVSASSNFRAAGICLTDAVGLAASTPVQAFSPVNPAGVAHDVNALGLVVNVLNFTTASVLAPPTTPGTHQTIINKSAVPRQIHVASISQAAAGTYDPGAATTGPGSEESTAFAIVAQPTAIATFPAAPTVPTFNAGSAITLGTLSADIAAAVAAQPPGTHFQLIAGTYTNWSNVRPKTGMHFKGPASGVAVLNGTGKTWAFRAIDATGSSDNVTISGPVGSIKIQDYGAGTTRAEYGAIQAQPTDTSVGSTEFTYGTAQNWFIQGVELSKNGAQGIRVSDYFTLYQVTAYGHNVSNVGGDRGVGGLIHSCTLDAGGLNPATGVASNGAGAKFTFWNASEGRSQVVPSASLRPKAPIKVVSTNMTATHAGVTGTGNIGLWFDLDCQLIEIYGGNYTNHNWCGIVVEGCNNVYMTGIAIDNSDGYGATNGEDFILGGLTIAESTNVTVENYGILNSDRALIIRQSNRTADWYNSNNASFVNYAWPTTSGGVRYWITADGPLPVPGLSDRANMWSGNITLRNGLYTLCNKVILSEGTNGGGMSTSGSLPLNTIHFEGNNYSSSPGILFYNRSTTGINEAAWKALPFDRDN